MFNAENYSNVVNKKIDKIDIEKSKKQILKFFFSELIEKCAFVSISQLHKNIDISK